MRGTERARKWQEVEWRGIITLSVWKPLLQRGWRGVREVCPNINYQEKVIRIACQSTDRDDSKVRFPETMPLTFFYSFIWNGKAVNSVRSVFKLSPVQTLPRTGFSLYTVTIGEFRTNAPTKRPEKEGRAKLWEKNEGVTHSVWWLQNRFQLK